MSNMNNSPHLRLVGPDERAEAAETESSETVPPAGLNHLVTIETLRLYAEQGIEGDVLGTGSVDALRNEAITRIAMAGLNDEGVFDGDSN